MAETCFHIDLQMDAKVCTFSARLKLLLQKNQRKTSLENMTFKQIADEERYFYVKEVPKSIRENYVIAEGELNTYKVKLQRRYQSCNRHRCTRSDCHSMHTALSLFQGMIHFFLFRKDPFCLLCYNPSTIIQRDFSSLTIE